MNQKLTEQGWTYRLDLAGLQTPISNCVCLRVGQVDQIIIQQLDDRKLDQAPLLDGEDQVIGLLGMAEARRLCDTRLPLEHSNPSVVNNTVTSELTIKDLLATLRNHVGALVLGRHRTGDRSAGDYPVGLITRSDLNRHPFRSYLYEILAELESDLAVFLDNRCEDHWAWLTRLSEDKQARIIGYWEISKRKNVDVGPVAATVLSELLNVVAALPALRSVLGFQSKTQFDEDCHSSKIIDIRNRVMHPVRPLIAAASDMCDLESALEGVFLIADRLRTATANIDASQPCPTSLDPAPADPRSLDPTKPRDQRRT